MTSPPVAEATDELRTLECVFGLTDYSEPVEAAKEYMRSSGRYFTRQHSRRFITAVKKAWDEVRLDAQVKGRREDPTGWVAVRRVLSQEKK